jgi:ornithine cyclodeaminase/alanine dehydrogenase-like protein (mu-crystallin family)
VPSLGVHALRIVSEIIQEVEDGSAVRLRKIPAARGNRYVGLVLLFDIHTTEPLAIIQESGLQRLRVGVTSALAAKHLARPDSQRVAMFGTGWQAETQLRALIHTLPISRVEVFSTSPEKRSAFVDRMSQLVPVEVAEGDGSSQMIRNADIVVCCTNSLTPVFSGADLHEGQHVNSLQAGELDRVAHERADLICIRSIERSLNYLEKGATEKPRHGTTLFDLADSFQEKWVELGSIIAGFHPGRTDPRQITLFGGSGTGPSSGLGLQFAATGKAAFEEAQRRGLGVEVPTELFLQQHR